MGSGQRFAGLIARFAIILLVFIAVTAELLHLASLPLGYGFIPPSAPRGLVLLLATLWWYIVAVIGGSLTKIAALPAIRKMRNGSSSRPRSNRAISARMNGSSRNSLKAARSSSYVMDCSTSASARRMATRASRGSIRATRLARIRYSQVHRATPRLPRSPILGLRDR